MYEKKVQSALGDFNRVWSLCDDVDDSECVVGS